jgi:hypothetical protein
MVGEPGSKTGQPPADADVTTFSNGIRLTGGEWVFAGVCALLLGALAPALWKEAEPCALEPDHRMPHELGNDYWLYERYAGLAADQYDGVIIGDSVVWGEYVNPHETLSHYLNELAGRERYANLGMPGAHPLALAGLVEHYAGRIRGKDVLLHCDPLWMSSPRADLQDDKLTDLNHPRLLPQFTPRIPPYKAEVSPRIGVVVEQHAPLSSWTSHLQQAYYDHKDIPSWTLEHPYDNPVEPLTRGLPPPDESRRYDPRQPWYKRGIGPQDFPWVDLDTSLQWQGFRRLVQILRERDNRVFVLVGPFNEHLLTAGRTQIIAQAMASRAVVPSRPGAPVWPQAIVALKVASLEASALPLTEGSWGRYQEVKRTIAAWLREQQIPHAVPDPLPSELYGDDSHPLPPGYKQLARQLQEAPFFRSAGSGP